MRDPSVTPTTLSELRMLLLVDHMNVCRLRSVLIGADHEPICLALDMYECDLHNLLRKYKIRFQSKEVGIEV